MRFDRVRLENFKPYDDADVSLDRGVTVIHGLNGSGKSSLLEACFFALYGSGALSGTLEDVVTTGEEESIVELWFTHAGGSYRIERRIRLSGDRAQTAHCVLETPEETVDGARGVRQQIADLLRMDADAFVNCAYVRQGEVNKLIHASPADRQNMIDELLQLGTLEEYRERAGDARLAVEDVLNGFRERKTGLADQIEAKEEKNLPARLNELESERNELDGEIERYESQIEEAENTRDEALEVLETHEERREELVGLGEEIEELREAVEETERQREQLREEIRTKRDELEEFEARREELLSETTLSAADLERIADRIEALREEDEALRDRLEEVNVEIQRHASEAERARERAEERDQKAEEARAEASDLATAIEEDEETLIERREKLETLETRIVEERERFEEAPVDFGEAATWRESIESDLEDVRERTVEVRSSLESARSHIEKAESLREAGKCPECGQSVEDSPHVDALETERERVIELEEELETLIDREEELSADRERAEALREAEREVARLKENRRSIEQLLSDREEALSERRDRRARLVEEAEKLAGDAEASREEVEEIEAKIDSLREDIAELNGERRDRRERRERLGELAETVEEIDACETAIDERRERREELAELADERRERLQEKRERREEIELSVDEAAIERARSEKERAVAYLEQAGEALTELQETRDDVQSRIGAAKNELDELADLREREAEIDKRIEALESLHGEAETLQATYAQLRAELRQRNVETLERMLNETFELVYQNDSYAKIELDGEYELTVYQKDGQALDPELLSGGERALFNLSLRCAIYRLLAEGIEGAAPMPPLILDEPTVFLDSGHVTRLVDLVESMRDLGVEQIIVVSHDDELVGAADQLVTVWKDPTTNRSSLERSEALSIAD